MKKIFLILGMIFCVQACHAVGVDCWEEVDMTFNPNTKSKMTDVLKGTTITRVKTEVDMVTPAASISNLDSYYSFASNGLTHVRIPISSYLYFNYKNTTDHYYLEGNRIDSDAQYGFTRDGGLVSQLESQYNDDFVGFQIVSNGMIGKTLGGVTHSPGSGASSLKGYYSYSRHNYNNSNGDPVTNRVLEYVSTFHYIHTYCIVNTNSGGGGGAGGSAGAAVNYIIKAN